MFQYYMSPDVSQPVTCDYKLKHNDVDIIITCVQLSCGCYNKGEKVGEVQCMQLIQTNYY